MDIGSICSCAIDFNLDVDVYESSKLLRSSYKYNIFLSCYIFYITYYQGTVAINLHRIPYLHNRNKKSDPYDNTHTLRFLELRISIPGPRIYAYT